MLTIIKFKHLFILLVIDIRISIVPKIDSHLVLSIGRNEDLERYLSKGKTIK